MFEYLWFTTYIEPSLPPVATKSRPLRYSNLIMLSRCNWVTFWLDNFRTPVPVFTSNIQYIIYPSEHPVTIPFSAIRQADVIGFYEALFKVSTVVRLSSPVITIEESKEREISAISR
jgi:hypothetical protein